MYASWMLRVSFLAFVCSPRSIHWSFILRVSLFFVLGASFAYHKLSFACNFLRQFFFVILNLLVQFTVLFFLVSLLVLVFHLILLLSCKYFVCFICFFHSVCRWLLSLSFVVIFSSLCIYLIFVLQYRFSLFQIACHCFVSVVERP